MFQICDVTRVSKSKKERKIIILNKYCDFPLSFSPDNGRRFQGIEKLAFFKILPPFTWNTW